jgi:sulfonate dioxygenase
VFSKCTDGIVTRYIVGYKKEESDFLLKFLYDHIALSQDIQTRVRWRPGTVVVWDVSHIHTVKVISVLMFAEPCGSTQRSVRLGGRTETPSSADHSSGRASIRDAVRG